ncbi:UDP-forming cellulose synthase catalytic subunit [Chromobacterium phragmitis]|uniref:Cellulose synthase catalytic subunit [UDP-forming] n=1 Tax=Chromobacterium phragmitis TaxID=2202141 RepID=A0ABV0INU4_9NEIS|nr:UDP-forming cellulose synthase catalytic subunit [Chromobacterium phragmitis]AXE32035.1 UDP-forming cellulose synthase catalytic subunit [Chromobacterium phragmitis]
MRRAVWAAFSLACGLRHPADSPSMSLAVLSLLFVTPAQGWEAWARRARAYFPHVDFDRPSLADALRILLQLLWLALVKPPGRHMAYESDMLSALRDARRLASRAFDAWRRGFAALAARYPSCFDPERLRRTTEGMAGYAAWESAALRYACYLMTAMLAAICVTTPFDESSQAVFSAVLLLIALWVRRIPGQVSNLVLMVFSMVVSTRYIWWRATSTINDDTWLNLTFGLILLMAEIFAWIVLLLGFFQSSWTLKRLVAPLPEDNERWPTVDVFIPIYNEPLRVLKPTVMAALALDWPFDKLRVHVLDDGCREEVRTFAESVGAGYIVRPEHKHAKAGNINHALGVTSACFVAIFDCDHIPTRSFLKSTMGGFLKDDKLALVQTPHHFFSADPFERNLDTHGKVPNEGELFYGRVQDGNDLWNATFFCGSCAVLRRSHLMEVGGIATDTVTEDAHTSLKLHRLGYRSSYINVVQAAGLATESLSAHIGQRIRWARGMAQIFRCDNPLLGKGLSLAQRFCYLNAMLHFLNGVPRLVFLTSPMAFLIFHAYTIYAPALGIVLYVVPHMIFSVLSNSRLNGRFRRSFWGEVYETVLAWYIVIPTTVALLFPGLGKFNVTAKGGVMNQDFVDWDISKPYLCLLAFNLLGIGFGVWRLAAGPDYEMGTAVINMFWAGYNAMLLGVALAVARELRQVRVAHRVRASLPVTLHLPDGRAYRCWTLDYSEGGMALQLARELRLSLARDAELTVSLRLGERSFAFPCQLVFAKGDRLSVRFADLSLEQEGELVQCTFGRPDAWVAREEFKQESSPLGSALDILRMGWHSLRGLLLLAVPSGADSRRGSVALKWLLSLLPRQPFLTQD